MTMSTAGNNRPKVAGAESQPPPARHVIPITGGFGLDPDRIELLPIRASGPGGQNVNKVSSACELRFDPRAAGMPEEMVTKLLRLAGARASKDGVIIIKAQRFRDLARNKADAIDRLVTLCHKAALREKKRLPTKPGKAAKERRLDAKARDSAVKRLRRTVEGD